MIASILDGITGDELWEVLQRSLQIGEGTSKEVSELLTDYALYCCLPNLSQPQPFKFNSKFTKGIADLTLKTKLTLAKTFLKGGWREPKLEGLVQFNRILFGLYSILADLEAEADWNQILKLA
jgi:hypothetical protein